MNPELQTYVDDFTDIKNTPIEELPESGSGRKYYRFQKGDTSVILTENENVAENVTFIHFSRVFENLNVNTPQLLNVHPNKKWYIQEDLGQESLLQMRLENPEQAVSYYEKAVKKLAHLQIGADQIIDYKETFDAASFDRILVLRDLFYFKDYFLDFQSISYNQNALLQEFDKIADRVSKMKFRYFMFRDFQGRNIMIHNDEPYFIDYQGGMKGPVMYDMASLLWQAKAKLSQEEKEYLLDVYFQEIKNLIPDHYKRVSLEKEYSLCVLIRLLQVLGAYGKLGVIQQKSHFKESIAFGLKNLENYAAQFGLDEFPEIRDICQKLTSKNTDKAI